MSEDFDQGVEDKCRKLVQKDVVDPMDPGKSINGTHTLFTRNIFTRQG
jgi:hypothetical protein